MKYGKWRVVLMITLVAAVLLSAQGLAQELSFDDAVELMYENNTTLKIAQLNLEIAQIDYDKAMASNLMSGSQHSAMQAEHSLERAKNTYRNTRQNSYLEIFRAYTDVLAAERTLEIRELELITAEHNFTVVQEKVRIGDAGKLDELQEMNRVEAARRNENTARQTLVEKQRVLRRLVGLSDDATLELSSDFPVPELELSLEDSIQIGLDNSFSLWDQEYSLELQERQLQTSRIDGTPPIDLKRAELNAQIARLNLEQEKTNIAESIASAYHSLVESRARYTSATRDWEIAQESYEIYERQAEIGLITDMQLLQQKISMLNSRNALVDASVGYLTSYIQFHHTLGLDGSIQ